MIIKCSYIYTIRLEFKKIIYYTSLQFKSNRYLIEVYTKWVQVYLRHFVRRNALKKIEI